MTGDRKTGPAALPVLIDTICDEFEQERRSGGDRPLEEWLPDDPAARPAILVELIRVELQLRLAGGATARAEEYLTRFPELSSDLDAVMQVAAAEFQQRRRLEPSLGIAEYRERFPQLISHPRWTSVFGEAPTLLSPKRSNGAMLPETVVHRTAVSLADIPGYELLAELGHGAMGVVYKAQQAGTKRLVALKMIRSGSQTSAEGSENLRAEAEAVARFQHPNIVQIYEVGEHQGQMFLALELADGGTLGHYLAGKPQPASGAAVLVETLARTMHYAHSRGVVHRDLKPANILLSLNGASLSERPLNEIVPKITDFGLAKRLDEVGSTQSGAIKGTPSYMAPEQALGQVKDIGPAADVYALGAILYECLTGRPPFTGTTILDILNQVSTLDPLRPSRLQPTVPTDLETICLKCLNKDRSRRYATAAALADDLRRFLEREPILARPTPVRERLGKWMRRKPGQAALVGVATLAILALIVILALALHISQRELKQRDERDAAQRQIEKNWREAEKYETLQQWGDAEREWAAIIAALAARPESSDEDRSAAQQHLDQVRQHIRDDDTRAEAQNRPVQCRKLYHKALFHAFLLTGDLDLSRNREQTIAHARQGLKLYDLDREQPPAERLTGRLESDRPFLDAAEFTWLTGACYELLLTWAEAEAVILPGEAVTPEQSQERGARALSLLDRAALLGRTYRLDTQAFYERKAHYLALRLGKPFDPSLIDPAAPREPTGARDWFLQALEHYREGQFDLMGSEALRAAQFDKAARACAKAIAIQEDHFGARYLHGLCSLRARRWLEAKNDFTVCLNQQKEFVLPRVFRGFASSELGFEYLQLARQAKGLPEPAEREFASAQTDLDFALSQQLDSPTRYVVLANRGVLRIRQERWTESIGDLEQAVKINLAAYHAHVNLAQAFQGAGRPDRALRAIDEAIQNAPHLPELYQVRAEMHLRQGHSARARADFEQAIAREPKDSKSERLVHNLVELGQLLHREGNFSAALARYDRALHLDANYVLTERFRAETLLALNRETEAAKALDHYLAVNKSAAAEVYRARGLIHAGANQLPAAIEMYSLALRQNPDDIATRSYRGWAYLFNDAARPALADFEICLRKDATDADALAGRGSARIHLKQLTAAVEDAQAAEKYGPLTDRLLYNLARIYSQVVGQLEAEIQATPPGVRVPSRERQSQFEDKAIDCLSRALAKLPPQRRGKFWRSQVEADPAFGPLRRATGYQRLATYYSETGLAGKRP